MISLSPDEVERRFLALGIPHRFTPAEKEELATTNVVGLDERWFGFPVPRANQGLNILNLRHIRGTDPARIPSFFDHPWYLAEGFSVQDCEPGWRFLSMSVLPETVSQSLNDVRSTLGVGLEIPSAIELALMLFLHYAGTGEHLLLKKHSWCRDSATLNRNVTVGAFGRNGLFVSAHPASYASRGLGCCVRMGGKI